MKLQDGNVPIRTGRAKRRACTDLNLMVIYIGHVSQRKDATLRMVLYLR